MRNITLEELLEAGCHFGHQLTRQNPKARDFVFEARDNIHIIDLAKTKEGLEEAGVFIKELSQKGGTMIILGAKRQAQDVVREEIKRAYEAGAGGIYYVTNRWIGGLLTNFSEVAKNFKKYKTLGEKLESKEERAEFTKKEISMWEKERAKLESFYGGVADLTQVPQAVFIIDTHLEDLAVREALATGIKTIGITDTNSDPTKINFAIPANDDAVGSIKLIVNYLIDAWIEGKNEAKQAIEKIAKQQEIEIKKKEKEVEKAEAKKAAAEEKAQRVEKEKKEQATRKKIATLKAENKAEKEKAKKKA